MATLVFISARIRGIGLGLGLIALLLSAPSPVWSQPEPLSSATYQAVFEGTWTAENHPTGFPSNPHFSSIVGAVHNADATLWMAGAMATPGLEHVAETGMPDMLQEEVAAQIGMGDALAVVLQTPPDNTGTVTMTFYFSVTDAFPLVTLAAAIAPSPDWFVGVSGLSLQDDHDDHGHWMTSHTVDLFPYDAGTEDGTMFSIDNADSMPVGSIMSARGVAPFSDQPMARLTFELVEERAFHAALEQPTTGPVAGIGLVRGWAFESSDMDMMDDDPLTLEVLVDGKSIGSPAVGSPRGDVAANFPDEMDAEDSGFGLVMNYGVLDPGTHLLTLRGTSAMGGAHFAISREITVLKFGGFEFAEAMLSGATADMHGDAVALHGVQFSDPNDPDAMGRTQTLELEWSNAAQGFIVTSITDEDEDEDDDHDHDHDHD